jgi:uncharacterized protein (UPF0335 family)
MASEKQVDLIIRLTAITDLKAALKQTKALTKEFTKLHGAIKRTQKSSEQLAKSVTKNQQLLMKATNRQVKSLSQIETIRKRQKAQLQEQNAHLQRTIGGYRNLQNATMGLGFTFLFGGMAIKNFFQSMFNGLFNTFTLVHGEGSEQQAVVNRLAGAWEYMKWSIMNALWQSGLFTWFVESLITIIHWVSNLSDGAKQGIGIAIVAFIGLGAVMMVAGQIALLATGYFTALTYIASTGGTAAAMTFSTLVGSLLLALLALTTLIATFFVLSNIFGNDGPQWNEALIALITSITGIGIALKLMGFSWAVAFGPIGIGIAALIALLFMARSATDSWGDAFILMALSIVRAVQHIGSFILTAVLFPVVKMLDIIDRGLRALGHKGILEKGAFSTIKDLIDTGLGGKFIQAEIEAIMSPKLQREAAESGQLKSTTLYSRAMLEQNPSLAQTDPVGYGASIKALRDLGAPLPTNYSGQVGGVPTPQDILASVPGSTVAEQTNPYADEMAKLEAEIAELKANAPTAPTQSNVTFEIGTVVGDSQAFVREVKEMLEREQVHTFGSPSI